MKKYFKIPMYKVGLWVVVAEDACAERSKMSSQFGEWNNTEWAACHCHSGDGLFGLFFHTKHLTIEVVAHEVFHCTHGIMDWVCQSFEPQNHEVFALLHGYLFDMVFKCVKRYLK